MQFITDPWQPLGLLHVRFANAQTPMAAQGNYEARHWLVFVGAALFVLAPIAGILSGVWATTSLLASLALLLVSFAVLLVPEDQELDAYESSEDRRHP